MKKTKPNKSKLVIFIVGLIVIVGIIAIGICQIKNEDTIKLTNLGLVPVGFKELRKEGFSVAVPASGWTASFGTFEPGQSKDHAVYFVEFAKETDHNGTFGPEIRILDTTLEEAIANEKGANTPKEAVQVPWTGKEEKAEKGPYPGVKLTWMPGTQYESYTYLFEANGKVYRYGALHKPGTPDQETSEILYDMFESFKLY